MTGQSPVGFGRDASRAALSATPSRQHRVGEEAGIERSGGRSVLVVARQEITGDFASPRDLAHTVPVPSWIGQRQIEQLERTIERSGEAPAYHPAPAH
jgi:hypothetical protein